MLDEPGAVLVLGKLDYMVGQVAELDARVTVVPEKIGWKKLAHDFTAYADSNYAACTHTFNTPPQMNHVMIT